MTASQAGGGRDQGGGKWGGGGRRGRGWVLEEGEEDVVGANPHPTPPCGATGKLVPRTPPPPNGPPPPPSRYSGPKTT